MDTLTVGLPEALLPAELEAVPVAESAAVAVGLAVGREPVAEALRGDEPVLLGVGADENVEDAAAEALVELYAVAVPLLPPDLVAVGEAVCDAESLAELVRVPEAVASMVAEPVCADEGEALPDLLGEVEPAEELEAEPDADELADGVDEPDGAALADAEAPELAEEETEAAAARVELDDEVAVCAAEALGDDVSVAAGEDDAVPAADGVC